MCPQKYKAEDVAAELCRIATKNRLCTSVDLHDLLYLCQVESLKQSREPLFEEEIVASKTGPEVKSIGPIPACFDHLYSEGAFKNAAKIEDETVLNLIHDVAAYWLPQEMGYWLRKTHIFEGDTAFCRIFNSGWGIGKVIPLYLMVEEAQQT